MAPVKQDYLTNIASLCINWENRQRFLIVSHMYRCYEICANSRNFYFENLLFQDLGFFTKNFVLQKFGAIQYIQTSIIQHSLGYKNRVRLVRLSDYQVNVPWQEAYWCNKHCQIIEVFWIIRCQIRENWLYIYVHLYLSQYMCLVFIIYVYCTAFVLLHCN